MSTMKAVRIHTYGGRDILAYEAAPRPVLNEGDVLIRVHAASVNPVDWAIRAGYMVQWFNHKLPLVLGLDASGVIEEIGSGANGFAPGDAVIARSDVARDGTYAEYVAVPASQVVRKPRSLDHLHSAAIPHAALTAWQSLFGAAGLTAGQTVLVHAAAGGVGSFAVQFAKHHGARVIGTASTRNQDFLRQLGVDQAIDYTSARFEDVVHDVDVVLDNVGGETLLRSWQVLRPGGVLVSIVEPSVAEKAAPYGVRGVFPYVTADAGILNQIVSLVDAGQVKPAVSSVFPLGDIQQAHALSESYHARGKIALQVAD